MMDWFKAGFLFPIFRNHTVTKSRQQEPWAFGARALKVLRHFIQLRYRFRPYLYHLFCEHERTGEAILRPLFYDFKDSRRAPLGLVDDEFLVGPWILQAPFVDEDLSVRRVTLPAGVAWYDLNAGKWLGGGQKIQVSAVSAETPIYIRDGAILPLARLDPASSAFLPDRIDFHIFLAGDGAASLEYRFDDGLTFDYQRGVYSEAKITAERKDDSIGITTEMVGSESGPGNFTFTTLPEIRRVTIDSAEAEMVAAQGIAIGKSLCTWAAPRVRR
jgi:alpha-glucosidase